MNEFIFLMNNDCDENMMCTFYIKLQNITLFSTCTWKTMCLQTVAVQCICLCTEYKYIFDVWWTRMINVPHVLCMWLHPSLCPVFDLSWQLYPQLIHQQSPNSILPPMFTQSCQAIVSSQQTPTASKQPCCFISSSATAALFTGLFLM